MSNATSFSFQQTARPRSGRIKSLEVEVVDAIRRDAPVIQAEPIPASQGVRGFDFARNHATTTSLEENTSGTLTGDDTERRRAFIEEMQSSGEFVSREHFEQELARVRAEAIAEQEQAHQQQLEEMEQRHQEALTTALDELQRWREAMTHQSTELLLRLTETITLHLVQESLMEQPERYVQALKPALQSLMGFDRPRLYVPPFAVAELSRKSNKIKSLHPDHIDIEILADEDLVAGDFRFEVDGGAVHAELERRLNQLVQTCRERALKEFADWDDEDDAHEADEKGE